MVKLKKQHIVNKEKKFNRQMWRRTLKTLISQHLNVGIVNIVVYDTLSSISLQFSLRRENSASWLVYG